MTRLVPWLLSLTCIAMVAAGQLFIQDRRGEIEIHAPMRSVTALDDSRAVSVLSFSVGQSWSRFGEVRGRTTSIFLVVEADVDNRIRSSGALTITGYSGERDFLPSELSIDTPQPGFRETGTFLFELAPEDLAGFSVGFETQGAFVAVRRRVVVDLGIDSATAERLVATADERTLPLELPTDVPIP